MKLLWQMRKGVEETVEGGGHWGVLHLLKIKGVQAPLDLLVSIYLPFDNSFPGCRREDGPAILPNRPQEPPPPTSPSQIETYQHTYLCA